jgi:hypothetical protein
MEPSTILARLIEIGEALSTKGEVMYASDIHRIRELVVNAQDLLLRMEKESLQPSIRY